MYEAGLGAPLRGKRLAPYPALGLAAAPRHAAIVLLNNSPVVGFGLGAPTPITYRGDRLGAGQNLTTHQGIQSKNGRVKVVLQTDGNFVLYGDGQPLWWTGVRPGTNLAAMQKDGNFVLYKPDEGDVWNSETAGHPGAYLVAQDDGNLVIYWGVGGSALWSSETNGFRYYGGPGKGLDFEDVLEVAGDVLAVAQVVISFVPVIGQGINAAIAAGGALARGENITDALAAGVKNALPGGPLAAAAFDAAVAAGKAIANGESIGDAALAATRAALPSEAAKRAFDVGLAVVQGQSVQQAFVRATASLAPAAVKVAADIFQNPALLKLPLAEAAKLLKSDPATVAAAKAAIESNTELSTPPVRRPPPVLKAPPPLTPSPRLVADLAAVARKNPKATDAEVLYVAVTGDSVLAAHANRLSPKLISNMIAVARAYPAAKDAEILYVASIPVPKKKLALKPPTAIATAPAPRRGAYAPYPKMVA